MKFFQLRRRVPLEFADICMALQTSNIEVFQLLSRPPCCWNAPTGRPQTQHFGDKAARATNASASCLFKRSIFPPVYPFSSVVFPSIVFLLLSPVL